MNHLAGRNWTFNVNGGYSRISQVQQSKVGASTATTYRYWYGGGSIRRQLGRYFGAFVSYQYNFFFLNIRGCPRPAPFPTATAARGGRLRIGSDLVVFVL